MSTSDSETSSDSDSSDDSNVSSASKSNDNPDFSSISETNGKNGTNGTLIGNLRLTPVPTTSTCSDTLNDDDSRDDANQSKYEGEYLQSKEPIEQTENDYLSVTLSKFLTCCLFYEFLWVLSVY